MNSEQTLNEILEIVQFLKDNAVTKTELQGVEQRFETRLSGVELRLETRLAGMETRFEERLMETKNELMTHIDGFIHLNQKLDHELMALRSKYERLEEAVFKIAHHLQLDLGKS